MKLSAPDSLLSSLLSLLLSSHATGGVEITKCCPGLQVLGQEVNTCHNSRNTSGEINQQIFNDFPPRVYSVETGEYVEEELVVRDISIPECEENEKLSRVLSGPDTGDAFFLLAEENSLFLPSHPSSHSSFCLDTVPGSGTAALLCVPDPAVQCRQSVCVSSCCPENMLVDLQLGDCTFRDNYTLVPPFRPESRPEDYLMVYGEPQCDTHVYNQEEFLLGQEGRLEIDHHHLNVSQYCIQEVQQGQDTAFIAKVCYQGDDQERVRQQVISRRLTPALLIISEIFLLLTFVLHVIVPEFRKQMFGGLLSMDNFKF